MVGSLILASKSFMPRFMPYRIPQNTRTLSVTLLCNENDAHTLRSNQSSNLYNTRYAHDMSLLKQIDALYLHWGGIAPHTRIVFDLSF